MCGKALLITGWCKYGGDNCVNVRTLSNVIMVTNSSLKKGILHSFFALYSCYNRVNVPNETFKNVDLNDQIDCCESHYQIGLYVEAVLHKLTHEL